MIFRRFIQKHIPGLRVLPISTEQFVPGVILDREKLRLMGHCREILHDEPESAWTYTLSKASMIYGTVQADRKLGGGVKVLGIISLRSGYLDDIRVHIDISEVRGAALDMYQMELQPKLNALRKTDRRGRWRLINDHLVVMETYYASKFKATFYRKNQLLARADLDAIATLDLEGHIEYQWETDHSLVVANNEHVPFGVRGFVV